MTQLPCSLSQPVFLIYQMKGAKTINSQGSFLVATRHPDLAGLRKRQTGSGESASHSPASPHASEAWYTRDCHSGWWEKPHQALQFPAQQAPAGSPGAERTEDQMEAWEEAEAGQAPGASCGSCSGWCQN